MIRNGETLIPEHLSKAQDIPLAPGDRVRVRTPGGGGYGDPRARDRAAVAEDVRLGRYTAEEAEACSASGSPATERSRRGTRPLKPAAATKPWNGRRFCET